MRNLIDLLLWALLLSVTGGTLVQVFIHTSMSFAIMMLLMGIFGSLFFALHERAHANERALVVNQYTTRKIIFVKNPLWWRIGRVDAGTDGNCQSNIITWMGYGLCFGPVEVQYWFNDEQTYQNE